MIIFTQKASLGTLTPGVAAEVRNAFERISRKLRALFDWDYGPESALQHVIRAAAPVVAMSAPAEGGRAHEVDDAIDELTDLMQTATPYKERRAQFTTRR